MELSHASVRVKDREAIRVNYYPAHTTDYGMDVPSSLHVHVGSLSVWGSPADVVSTLTAAVGEARFVWDAEGGDGPNDGPGAGGGAGLAVVPGSTDPVSVNKRKEVTG